MVSKQKMSLETFHVIDVMSRAVKGKFPKMYVVTSGCSCCSETNDVESMKDLESVAEEWEEAARDLRKLIDYLNQEVTDKKK